MRRLFFTHRSPFARKVRILLQEKGLPFEQVEVDLGHRSEEFTRLTPIGKVPVLEEEDGPVVFDSTVIAEYLEDRYPEVPFRAQHWKDRLNSRLWDEIGDQLADLTIQIWRERNRGAGTDPAVITKAEGVIGRLLDGIEAALEQQAYLGGESLSVGDISVVSALGYMSIRLGHGWRRERPNLVAWYEKLHERPSIRDSRPPET